MLERMRNRILAVAGVAVFSYHTRNEDGPIIIRAQGRDGGKDC